MLSSLSLQCYTYFYVDMIPLLYHPYACDITAVLTKATDPGVLAQNVLVICIRGAIERSIIVQKGLTTADSARSIKAICIHRIAPRCDPPFDSNLTSDSYWNSHRRNPMLYYNLLAIRSRTTIAISLDHISEVNSIVLRKAHIHLCITYSEVSKR